MLPPDVPAGELTALYQTPWLDLRGLLLRGEKGEEGKGTEVTEWEGR